MSHNVIESQSANVESTQLTTISSNTLCSRIGRMKFLWITLSIFVTLLVIVSIIVPTTINAKKKSDPLQSVASMTTITIITSTTTTVTKAPAATTGATTTITSTTTATKAPAATTSTTGATITITSTTTATKAPAATTGATTTATKAQETTATTATASETTATATTTITSITTATTSTTTATTTTVTVTTAAATTTRETTTTSTKTAVPISLVAVGGLVQGVYNTQAAGDSMAPTAGFNPGQYAPGEIPANAVDGNTSTKYLSFGSCRETETGLSCGLNTGFYLELQRGASLVTGLRICTADDSPQRDPMIVTLEGSNQSAADLILGSSWILIYHGNTGLQSDPDRYTCGLVQWFNNSNQYKSYRFLVLQKRQSSNCVQYSEVQLFGY